jgi:prophage regulatory protein
VNECGVGRIFADVQLANLRRHSRAEGDDMGTSSDRPADRVHTPDRLLAKRQLEDRTSLDITTIYRKMKAGTFPQPVRVGRRRVAWRESDIAAWQSALEVGVKKPVRQASNARVATKRR